MKITDINIGDIVVLANAEGAQTPRRVVKIDVERDRVTTVPSEGGGCGFEYLPSSLRLTVSARTKPRAHGL